MAEWAPRTCSDPLPPNNIVMGEKGLMCLDGTPIQKYVKQEMPKVPAGTPMVICTRELFEHLQQMAFLGHNSVA